MSHFEGFNIINKIYKEVQGHQIDLDIIYSTKLTVPHSEESPCPILLRFHGGGLVGGSSLYAPFFAPWLLQLIERHSAIIVSPNYRLIPEGTVQDALDDVEDAWQWIHHSLAEIMLDETGIHVDVNRIMTAGDSAGGYLSLHVGLNHPGDIRAVTAAYPAVDVGSPHFTGQYEKRVFGMPPMPRSTLVEHMKSIEDSGRTIVTADDVGERGTLMWSVVQHGLFGQFYPPQQTGLFPLLRLDSGDRFPRGGVLVWHGKDDTVVPVEGSLKLKQKIESVDPELNFKLVIRDGEHGFDHAVNLQEDWALQAMQDCVNSWLR
ncbi:Alpha/Beta hydrolase protein [Ilyonectria robusta]|uniref:Alpha/Beta hydrolase protein n=1 Tax=Ilyonectria robusta TaxID=1079257 RepID=UPI001E8D9FA0|nr:Alpha/Beta hydrolase protein [Ilyonectria robusta]KAH8665368.1 Alpha/Beta hydrolase protein [Ilyonectria robusta]